MEAIIDAANASGDKIDAVLAENDSTALGVAAALKNKSYGNVPISGQDGDTANLQNVAAGIQYVDVWKDANQLGKAAGAAALQLCEGKTIAEVALPDGVLDAASAPDNLAVQDFTTPGGNTVKSLILKVQPVTQDNLQKILDAKWLTKEVLCKNATDPATAASGLQVAVTAVVQSSALCSRSAATQGASFLRPGRRQPMTDLAGTAPEPTQSSGGFSLRRMVAATEIDLRLFGMLVALAAIWIGFGIVTGGKILAPASIVTLSVQTTVVAIMATGMVLVIVSRNIDLSVGSTVGVIAMTYALLMTDWLPNILGIALGSPLMWILALALGLALAVGIGALQGFIIAYIGVPSFIVTLGGLLSLRGFVWLLSSGAAINGLNETFQHFGGGATGSIGGTLTWVLAADRLRRRRRPAHQQPPAAPTLRLPGPPDVGRGAPRGRSGSWPSSAWPPSPTPTTGPWASPSATPPRTASPSRRRACRSRRASRGPSCSSSA